MRFGYLAGLLLLATGTTFASERAQRTLTFEDRVKAQEAIERVYYSHQIGVTKSFETAVPRAVLESKVQKYLDETAALVVYWKTAVTEEMLQRELERMARGTRMPERLLELYAALGNDPLVIKECLARATLVDRYITYIVDTTLQADTRRRAKELLPVAVAPGRGLRHNPTGTPSESMTSARSVTTNSPGDVDDIWAPTSTTGAPSPRSLHTAVWTGNVMVVWGGNLLQTGGRYDPTTDSWTPTSTTGAPSGRFYHTAVWTGSEMVVWGGYEGDGASSTGGRYNPLTDNWTSTSTAGAPSARGSHTAIWTGSRMVVWGGFFYNGSAYYLNTGGRYDPASDSWAPTTTEGAPSGRETHTAVWTGSAMVVWGGYDGHNAFDTGGRYDPVTDIWTPTSTEGAPTPRSSHTAIWTGNLMLIWGSGGYTQTGGRYDPLTDSWTPTSISGAPSGRHFQTAVWTGSVMVIWGGVVDGIQTNTGGRYAPITDSWTQTSTVGAPSKRYYHTDVWIGSATVVWGGYDGSTDVNTGGKHALDASVDNDGDGVGPSGGDCNDFDSTVYPGAPQLCDGKNNDCSDPNWPTAPATEANSDRDGFRICAGDCNDADATVYPNAPQLCDGKNNVSVR